MTIQEFDRSSEQNISEGSQLDPTEHMRSEALAGQSDSKWNEQKNEIVEDSAKFTDDGVLPGLTIDNHPYAIVGPVDGADDDFDAAHHAYANFDRLDRDGDGVLSREEIESQISSDDGSEEAAIKKGRARYFRPILLKQFGELKMEDDEWGRDQGISKEDLYKRMKRLGKQHQQFGPGVEFRVLKSS